MAATVLLQAVVIGAGWAAMLGITREGVHERVHDRALEECARSAQVFADELERVTDSPLRAGTPEWAKAQDLVVRSQPQDGGTLFLLDQSGKVLCHPALKRADSLAAMDFSQQRLRLYPSGEVIELGQLKPTAALTADTEFLSGSALLALRYAPDQRVKIVVTAPATSTATLARHYTSDVLLGAALAGCAVILITILGSIMLVRRYDTILMRANRQLEEELERRVRRGLAIRNGLIFGLAKLADYRDTDTGRHLERICCYCEILARSLQSTFDEITRTWIEQLKLAASMHDIGKVGIADSILLKPGSLTPEERRIMEMHAVIGADTLIAIRGRVGDDELINMGIQVALSHHERYDGRGYPYGLSGEQIPLSARIVALADIYDALTSSRVYKTASTHEEACRVILNCRGTHLDPRIVDAFQRVQEEFDAVRRQFKSTESRTERPALLTAVEQARAAQRRTAA